MAWSTRRTMMHYRDKYGRLQCKYGVDDDLDKLRAENENLRKTLDMALDEVIKLRQTIATEKAYIGSVNVQGE